jgi:hypothetical protein
MPNRGYTEGMAEGLGLLRQFLIPENDVKRRVLSSGF